MKRNPTNQLSKKMTVPHFKTLVFLFFVGTFMACSNNSKSSSTEPFSNCQFGAPKAIFSSTIGKVNQHNFQLNTESAVEKVQFDGGVYLELIQSGCEQPKQEFQFTIPTSTSNFKDADWLMMGIDFLGFMGSLAPELQPFLLWQGALKDKLGQLKIGLPHQLEPGFFVKMDKVAADDSGLLILTLYQE